MRVVIALHWLIDYRMGIIARKVLRGIGLQQIPSGFTYIHLLRSELFNLSSGGLRFMRNDEVYDDPLIESRPRPVVQRAPHTVQLEAIVVQMHYKGK